MERKASIHIIAVAYQRIGELKVFVQSIINQSNSDWFLTIIHDGPNSQFDEIMDEFSSNEYGKIEFFSSTVRFNDFGHSLREIALKNIKCDYVLLTNADNYFVPKAIEFLVEAIDQTNADVIMFDMVHSHHMPGNRPLPSYSFFETSYKRGSIDIGAAIVKRELSQKAGFRDKSHDGDATYFEDVLALAPKQQLKIAKIPRVLFIHN